MSGVVLDWALCVFLGPMNSVKFVNRRRRYITLWYSGAGVYWVFLRIP